MEAIEALDGLVNDEIKPSDPNDKKAEIHKNLKITLTAVAIVSVVLAGILNYYRLKKIAK